ncbi:hypothetical protein FQN54_000131 [Arachnomyces sp. PD_36]|nr:hypothetical protein FQN54_000131 [Arachnomyces sp. PD_36]
MARPLQRLMGKVPWVRGEAGQLPSELPRIACPTSTMMHGINWSLLLAEATDVENAGIFNVSAIAEFVRDPSFEDAEDMFNSMEISGDGPEVRKLLSQLNVPNNQQEQEEASTDELIGEEQNLLFGRPNEDIKTYTPEAFIRAYSKIHQS